MVYHYKQIYSDLEYFLTDRKTFSNDSVISFLHIPSFPIRKTNSETHHHLKKPRSHRSIPHSVCPKQELVLHTILLQCLRDMLLKYCHVSISLSTECQTFRWRHRPQPHATLLPTWRELERKGCASATVSRTGKKGWLHELTLFQKK